MASEGIEATDTATNRQVAKLDSRKQEINGIGRRRSEMNSKDQERARGIAATEDR